MAFKKNFWRDREKTMEDGSVKTIKEPSWYAEEPDPIRFVGKYKSSDPMRPEGILIPNAYVGDKLKPIKQAFEDYKRFHMEDFVLDYSRFKCALINGATFKTHVGIVRAGELKKKL